MERIRTTELPHHTGQHVHISGWLHRLRRLSNVSFLVLRDGYGTAQIVLEDPAQIEEIARLQPESVLNVRGYAAAVAQAPNGVEVQQPEISVIAAAEAPPPFEMFRPTIPAQLPTLLDHAPIALRHPRQRAIFRVSAAAMQGFRATLDGHGFTEIQTPKIVGAATEGGANVFALGYFGKPAFLSQSPQLYKQMMVGVFERVYEVGPAFRAEPHDTPRHINAFTSLDVEMGFISSHRDVMQMLNTVLQGMAATVAERAGDALALLKQAPLQVPAAIPRLHFTEALALIEQATGEALAGEPDLSPAHERWLGVWAQREHGSEFLFVEGYPTAHRAFYTAPDPQRPGFSHGFDLLFRGVELVSGGQRLHRYGDYLAVMEEREMNPANFGGYLETFRHGMPPHGGFAIGLERFVMRMFELPNLREATLFPRDLARLTP